MVVYRDTLDNGNIITTEVFHIKECTYTGKDMGERKITATFNWETPIDFQIGDYVELQMQTLQTGMGVEGSFAYERFYLYTKPVEKKSARPMSSGQAFEYSITFYPRQYELGCVQMRDCLQENANADTIIYTGFDQVSFVGGAHELMERIIGCLNSDGQKLWSYEMAASINEDINPSLERFPFAFSGNSCMDALLKLNDKDGINTTFFINGRTIYVGYKRPYFCKVVEGLTIDTDLQTQIFNFEYGKTSHLPATIDYGGLFNITKTVGSEAPITKLYAYGAARNLNRYYCSDRIKSGRYVNKLMLPSFDDDGRTDYITSPDGIAKYGIRESSKQFEEIYPSLRFMTYGDLRKVKYCIKIKASGLVAENDGRDLSGHSISDSTYPIVRVQCYKVVDSTEVSTSLHGESLIISEATKGVNTLVEAAPPRDLVVCIHALGKVVKTILYGGATDQEAISKQLAADGIVPTTGGLSGYIPGSCFAVHDPGFDDESTSSRGAWFTSPHDWSEMSSAEQENINTHQIHYGDTFWLTDLYVFESYDQTHFNRDGYSAWAWPRLNSKFAGAVDSTLVNEIVAVEPIVVEDTSWNVANNTNQQYFDIYMRDVGFKIDEQNDFGEMVFIVGTTLHVSVLDGLLTGREFEVNGKVVDSQFSCVCAYNEDGSPNPDFVNLPDSPRDSTGSKYALAARNAGAVWRIRLLRLNNDDQNYANLNIILPMKGMNMAAGDHVVFLDIFMPDIYIHAAENRLLREARKYLEANDKGSVQYAVNFDTVRMQQIAPYALQMREGLNVRLRDNDLEIDTSSGIKKIADYEDNPVYSQVQMFTDKDASYTDTVLLMANPKPLRGTLFYASFGEGYRTLALEEDAFCRTPIDTSNISSIKIGILNTHNAVREYEVFNSAVGTITARGTIINAQGTRYFGHKITLRFNETSTLKRMLEDAKIDVRNSKEVASVRVEITTRVYDYSTPQSLVPGAEFYCKAGETVDFRRGKFYEVVMDVENNGCAFDANEVVASPATGFPILSLDAVPASDGYRYTPDDTAADYGVQVLSAGAYYRFRYKFYLDDAFNDSYAYKPSIKFVQDGNHTDASIRLVIVTQKDIDTDASVVNYVDLKVDSLTLKMTDSEDPLSEPIREIQATFAAEPHASSWMVLSQQVADAAVEAQEAARVRETIVNMARRYYRDLLSLKGNIFDPDGNCDQVFLHTMMQQIGADSMNYRLEKTEQKLSGNGYLNMNYTLTKASGIWRFEVDQADTLYHYVFTEGAQGGTWQIAGGYVKNLIAVDNVFPPYFICLKCAIDGTSGEWVVDAEQHAVNELEGYYYFNWGILQPDSNGDYSLMETRGNAYMYGDNLVCGKVRSMTGGSYIDLNNGDMVLGGDSGGANGALEYKNGHLTIRGSRSNVDTLVKETVSTMTLGGRNILRGTDAFNYTLDTATQVIDTAKWRRASVTNAQTAAGVPLTASSAPISGITTCVQTTVTSNNNGWLDISQDKVPLGNGRTYTLSVYARMTAQVSTANKLHLGAWKSSSKYRTDVSQILTTEWKRYHFTFEWVWNDAPSIYIGLAGGKSGDVVQFCGMQLEEGSVLSSWRRAPEDVASDISAQETLMTQMRADLQGQIDGSISTWFAEGEPTLSNAPANEWNTTDLRDRHIGDLYYDKTTGYCYRFQIGAGNTYEWVRIADEGITEALTAASRAQAAADGKMKMFAKSPDPVPPYQVGDMWMKEGADGELYYAINTRTTGNHVSTDWVSASEYLRSHLNDYVKVGVRNLLRNTGVGIEHSSTTQSSGSKSKAFAIALSGEDLQSLRGQDIVVSADFNYTNMLSDGNTSASYHRVGMQVSITYSDGAKKYYGIWVYADATDSSTAKSRLSKKYTTEDKQITKVSANIYIQNVKGELVSISHPKLEFGKVATEWTPAPEDAEEAIGAAQQVLTDMASDSKVTAQEKVDLNREWERIMKEYAANCTEANKFAPTAQAQESVEGTARKAYKDAYDALNTYLKGTYTKNSDGVTTAGLLKDMSRVETIDATFNTTFNNYYDADVKILNAISDAIKKAADDGIAGVRETADAAKALLDDMADDGKLTPAEKLNLVSTLEQIDTEYAQNSLRAANYIDATVTTASGNYTTAYNSLRVHLVGESGSATAGVIGHGGSVSDTERKTTTDDANVINTLKARLAGYYEKNILLLEAIESSVQAEAQKKLGNRNYFAKKFMMEWNNTASGITSPAVDSDGRLYYSINENLLYRNIGARDNYNDILQGKVAFAANTQYCLKVKWKRLASESNGLYLGFKYTDGTYSSWRICDKDKTALTTDTLVSAIGKTVAGIRCTFGSVVNTRIYDISLTCGAKIPDDWMEADEDIEYGGENLYGEDDPLTISPANNPARTGVVLEDGVQYVISIGSITGNASSLSISYKDKGYHYYETIVQNDGGSTITPIKNYVTRVVGHGAELYFNVNGSTGSFTLSQIMVQRGNKPSQYQRYYKYIADAFENIARAGSTDIDGGMILTSLLKLRDQDGYVTAGMSGLRDIIKSNNTVTNHGVTLWGGGTYAEAIAAAGGGERIPILLTKDGIGSMVGVFTVQEDKIVVDVPGQGTIVIDADDGISILSTEGAERVVVTPMSIEGLGNKILNKKSTCISYQNHLVTVPYTVNESYVKVAPSSYWVVTEKIIFNFMTYVYIAQDAQFSSSGEYPDKVKFGLYAKNIDTGVITLLGETGYALVTVMDQDYGEGLFMMTQAINVNNVEITGKGGYHLLLKATYTEASGSQYSINELLNDAQNKIYLSDRFVNHQFANIYRYGTATEKNHVIRRHACTFVGSNGIASYYNDSTFFKVINNSDGQQIYALGLPTSEPASSKKGQLWNDGGTLKIRQ